MSKGGSEGRLWRGERLYGRIRGRGRRGRGGLGWGSEVGEGGDCGRGGAWF